MNDVNVPQGSSSSNPYVPPHKNSLEDTLHTFMQGQTQINQNVMKTLDELKTSIVRIESRLNVREKGAFPDQTQPNPKGQFEVKNSNLEQSNVVTTLRSGKVIETPMKVNEPEKSLKLKSSHSDIQNEQSEIHKKMHAPFPNRLLSTKQLADNKDILDVFQQVKINIPLLSVIKQVSPYAKFLKDLCTVKRKHNVQKKAFLTEQLGLGELKPTSVTLQLADSIEIHIILGRPFLATANALINCRNSIMNLSFGNMIVELKIFDACKYPSGDDDIHEVSMIETIVQEKLSHLEARDALESSLLNILDFDEDGSIE
ncbi:uncharacterized protein LOC113345781 [Papaver somniferum]|uniref:uncharacterized protein LOC113345781 n=1 Tax=Papaver somniferum TaxID=3469 RepID=UPI000E6F718E|nr:uncharacterized protein LOC113345781 [Papaver somniferum]